MASTSLTCRGVKAAVTLDVLMYSGSTEPFDKTLMSEWNQQYPCVHVKLTLVPFANLADKINVLAASANPPDIYAYDGPNTQTYAAQGILQPLGNAVPTSYQSDLLPEDREMLSYHGQLYGLTLGEAALALFYNKALVAKAGIHPPTSLTDAWTWSQALAAFQKCQQGPSNHPTVWGLAPTELGNGTPGFSYEDLLFARSAGDPNAPATSSLYKTFWAIAPDGKTTAGWLNTPEAIQADQFYQDLFNKYRVESKAGVPNLFLNGGACFHEMPTWYIGEAAAQKGLKWGVTPLPYFRTPIVHTGSTAVGVSAKSHHADWAARFVMFINTAQQQQRRLNLPGQESDEFPTLTSLYTSNPQLNRGAAGIFTQELEEWGKPRPLTPYYSQFDTTVSNALNAIADGSSTPQTALDNAVSQLNSMVSR